MYVLQVSSRSCVWPRDHLLHVRCHRRLCPRALVLKVCAVETLEEQTL